MNSFQLDSKIVRQITDLKKRKDKRQNVKIHPGSWNTKMF